MKQLALSILAFVFFTNMLVTAAWADPCMLRAEIVDEPENTAASMAVERMPCHDENISNSDSHCDEVCLCQHVMMSQTPVLAEVENPPCLIIRAQATYANDMMLISRIAAPLQRPPKHVS